MIENLRLYLLIVEKGGMAAAGREMGLAPATVSTRLAALEDHFGTRLLHRTTRSLSPTSEGQALLEGARRVLAEMDELESRVRYGASRLAGSIRLSAPSDLGRNWLMPLLDSFAEEHPELEFDVHLSDGYVDLTGQGFDLALRYGRLQDGSLRIRKLAELRRIVCAAPSYLRERGVPRSPQELALHSCLLMRFGEDVDRYWPFVVQGEELKMKVGASRIASDGEVVRRWCLGGHGVARKSEADIVSDLRSGSLVPLLEDFEAAAVDLQLIYPGGHTPSRRVRLLIDRLVEARGTLTAPGC